MEIKEILAQHLKLDFSSIFVERQGGAEDTCDFEISPRDFLRFAKSDFKSKDEKGYINALTNAKRAIDCQIDTAFSLFGITYDKLSKSAQNIFEFIESGENDLAFKLKLVRALDFAPSGLVSKSRNLRNLLEHYYKKPKKEEVNEAIELAELFILSIENRIRIIENDFLITDEKNYSPNRDNRTYMVFHFSQDSGEFYINFYADKIKIKEIKLNENDTLFYGTVKLFNNIYDEMDFLEALKVFLNMVDFPLAEKNVKLKFAV